MRKSIKWVVGLGLSLAIFISIRATKPDNLFDISKNLEIILNVFSELNTHYVDGINPGELTKKGLESMLAELDPYTNIITEADMEDYEFQTTGKYGGIGASLRRIGDSVFISDVYENSPSEKAGLKAGDLLLEVDQKSMIGQKIDDISTLLKGAPNTQLKVKILDAYTKKAEEKVLTRGEIEIASVPLARLVGKERKMGYVKLSQFTGGCSQKVVQALDSLTKVNGKRLDGVILDLRNNPGGLLDEAVKVTNLFVPANQLVVTTKGKYSDAIQQYKTKEQAWDADIPVAVLINGSSASASEIVAGTIQDLDRGIVLGQKSFGKGLVQTTKNVGYNYMLKLTTSKYYTPSGRCIQAIDYSHRDDKGKASKIADSLQETYKTKNGRLVKAGGGIMPDVVLPTETLPPVVIALYSKNIIFDYSTILASKYKTWPDVQAVKIDDATFNEFVDWALKRSDFEYQTKSQIALDSLISKAKAESYYDVVKSDLEALKPKLGGNKKAELLKHKGDIKEMLENEVVSRKYFYKGRLINGLQYDTVYLTALDYLENSSKLKKVIGQ